MADSRTIMLGTIPIQVDTYREMFMGKPTVRTFAVADLEGTPCIWMQDTEGWADEKVDSCARAAFQKTLDTPRDERLIFPGYRKGHVREFIEQKRGELMGAGQS